MSENRAIVEQEVQNLLKIFSTASAGQFVGRESDGHAHQTAERVLRFYKPLSGIDVSIFPDAVLERVRDRARAAFQTLQMISNTGPQNATSAVVERLGQLADEIFADPAPVILLAHQVREEKAHLKEAADEYKRASEVYLDEARRLLTNLQDITESAKSFAQEAGVARYGSLFAAVAEEHKSAAARWLTATIVLAVATAVGVTWSVWSVFYYAQELKQFTITMAVQLAVAKIVAFSMLVTALLWSGRMYRAHRHNHVVNRHRQNALNTFETFVQSARDPHTRDAVLLQATQSIFMPQSTGYLKEESDNAPTAPVFEVVRSLSS